MKAFPEPWKVYRIGGDEFVALHHGTGTRKAYETAAAELMWEILREVEEEAD